MKTYKESFTCVIHKAFIAYESYSSVWVKELNNNFFLIILMGDKYQLHIMSKEYLLDKH